eukprot:902225_1
MPFTTDLYVTFIIRNAVAADRRQLHNYAVQIGVWYAFSYDVCCMLLKEVDAWGIEIHVQSESALSFVAVAKLVRFACLVDGCFYFLFFFQFDRNICFILFFIFCFIN